MKMYTIAKGTHGILLELKDSGMVIERDWVVRKTVDFFDQHLIMDPVRLHNENRYDEKLASHRWAREGNAVFRNGKFALVVPYNQVKVH